MQHRRGWWEFLKFVFLLTLSFVGAWYVAIWLFSRGTAATYALGVLWLAVCLVVGLGALYDAKRVEDDEVHKSYQDPTSPPPPALVSITINGVEFECGSPEAKEYGEDHG